MQSIDQFRKKIIEGEWQGKQAFDRSGLNDLFSGISTEDNLECIRKREYNYVCVNCSKYA